MEVLYIIGNGFDLWHDLPTKYTDFHKFSEDHLDELEQYLDADLTTENPWHDFEAYLGKFDTDRFYDNHNLIDPLDESFKPSMVFGLEDELKDKADSLVNDIRYQFREWIESIPVENAKEKFYFESSGRFLSFNYTPLLQMIYRIEDDYTFHIHGSVSNHDQLIFGHGESKEIEPEFDNDGNSNRTMFSDAEGASLYPFFAFQKPVNDILNQNKSYFKSLNDIEIVIVLGHSLNDIDMPYFKKIYEITKSKKWIISQYSEDEGKSHLRQLKKWGIIPNQITLCSIDNIQTVLTTIQES
ncbi:bacteriophage abortive infection AbiH family protein [Sulfurovum sp.]|uniref:bacteriophage abortive infection AbiH family protein n=1 Tax=Sulfurovum sp. TaxID=1969726 RepID=UPI003569D26F